MCTTMHILYLSLFDVIIPPILHCSQSTEHYAPCTISALSVVFKDYEETFCKKMESSCMKNNTLISILMQASTFVFEPHLERVKEYAENDMVQENSEIEAENINPSMAMEILLLIAFESLDNFVDLVQNHAFLEHLSKFLDYKEISSYMSTIFGFPSFMDSNKEKRDDSFGFKNTSADTLSISLPLKDKIKENTFNFLLKGNLSSAKKILIDSMVNNGNTNNSQIDKDLKSQFTCTSSIKNSGHQNHENLVENKKQSAVSLFTRSFSGRCGNFKSTRKM